MLFEVLGYCISYLGSYFLDPGVWFATVVYGLGYFCYFKLITCKFVTGTPDVVDRVDFGGYDPLSGFRNSYLFWFLELLEKFINFFCNSFFFCMDFFFSNINFFLIFFFVFVLVFLVYCFYGLILYFYNSFFGDKYNKVVKTPYDFFFFLWFFFCFFLLVCFFIFFGYFYFKGLFFLFFRKLTLPFFF